MLHRRSDEFEYIPRNNMVLFKVFLPEDVSRGGVIIPDMAKDNPCMGTVLALGPGKEVSHASRETFTREWPTDAPGQPHISSEYRRFEPIAGLAVGDAIYFNIRKTIPVSKDSRDGRGLVDADDILAVVKMPNAEKL